MKKLLVLVLIFLAKSLFGSIKYVIIMDSWDKTETRIENYKEFKSELKNTYELFVVSEEEVNYKHTFETYESYFTFQTKKLWKTNESKINVLKRVYCGQIYDLKYLKYVVEQCVK